jgi:hypothetical protein
LLSASSWRWWMQPWWWRQQAPLKSQQTSTRLHGATTQKTAVFIQFCINTDIAFPRVPHICHSPLGLHFMFLIQRTRLWMPSNCVLTTRKEMLQVDR